jgi:K+-transporting ATPase KdpF subunit
MDLFTAVALFLAVALLVHLIVCMLFPEKF